MDILNLYSYLKSRHLNIIKSNLYRTCVYKLELLLYLELYCNKLYILNLILIVMIIIHLIFKKKFLFKILYKITIVYFLLNYRFDFN